MNVRVKLPLASAMVAGLLALASGFVVVQAADQAGASSQMSHESIEALIANAKTPQDHEAIAALYETEAKRLEVDAARHEKMAKLYESMKGAKRPAESIVRHCRNIAKNLRAAAKENAELAKMHREVAASGG
jgi:hypothetical protein